MTLPTTSLSFSALQTEYGGSNPISLSEYYLGGTAGVPPGQTSSYGTIPSSGQINVGVFRGTTKQADVISLTTQYITASFSGSSQASAVYGLSSDGYVKQGIYTTSQYFTNVEQWCNPASSTGNYEALIELYTGSLDFGTVGSWISLGSGTQYFRITANQNEYVDCTFTVKIRKIGTTTVLANCSVTLVADTSNG